MKKLLLLLACILFGLVLAGFTVRLIDKHISNTPAPAAIADRGHVFCSVPNNLLLVGLPVGVWPLLLVTAPTLSGDSMSTDLRRFSTAEQFLFA
jgi:hypothetical protein